MYEAYFPNYLMKLFSFNKTTVCNLTTFLHFYNTILKFLSVISRIIVSMHIIKAW